MNCLTTSVLFGFKILYLLCTKGKGLNIYDVWTSEPYHVTDGSTGKVACNSYNFYEKDVEALTTLGVRKMLLVLQ